MTTMIKNRALLCEDLTHDDLLRHYVQGAQLTVGSIDQLGNFLMGFGVLALGYLLNADLSAATTVFGATAAGGGHQFSALLTLASWGVAVGLLVFFVHTYVFHVLAGRSVHARDGREDAIGEVLDVPDDLSYQAFMVHQGSFEQFLMTHYGNRARRSPESLLYARWSAMRFMMLKKLGAMARMRGLLGLAVISGVAFKVLMTYQLAVVALN